MKAEERLVSRLRTLVEESPNEENYDVLQDIKAILWSFDTDKHIDDLDEKSILASKSADCHEGARLFPELPVGAGYPSVEGKK